MADSKQYITQAQENGNVMISEDVIATIVEHTLTEVDGVVKGGLEVVGKKSWGKGIRIALQTLANIVAAIATALATTSCMGWMGV